MAKIGMRPPSGGKSQGVAASGANPSSQKRISNSPAKASSKGMKSSGSSMGRKSGKGC